MRNVYILFRRVKEITLTQSYRYMKSDLGTRCKGAFFENNMEPIDNAVILIDDSTNSVELSKVLTDCNVGFAILLQQLKTHFTSRLSQKIRNIRWRWNKKGKKSLEGDGPPSKIMKKGPRRFELDPGSTNEILSLEQETDVILSMQEEMKKTKTERNKALLLRHQRKTFVGRRKYINTIGDGNIKSIVLKYPILALQEYIVKEFEIMKPDVKRQDLDDNWTDFFMVLDKMFEKDTEESDMEDNDSEIMKIIETLETKIKYKTSKKEMDLITKVKTTDVDLRSKKNSPPRAVVKINEDGKINNTYIIGDEVEIDAGKSFKNMLQLLMVYYVYDLSYPKCYQLLGFLQTFIFKDDTKFHKGANYLKLKDFIRVKENSTDADL